jgi:hypothetical protein
MAFQGGIIAPQLPLFGGSGIPWTPEVVDRAPSNGDGNVKAEKTQRQFRFANMGQLAQSYLTTTLASGSSDLTNVQPWIYWPGTYNTYRVMRRHPTIALGRALTFVPILSGNWSVENKKGADEKAIQLIRDTFLPKHNSLLAPMLFALDYGWQPFEHIWKVVDGMLALDRMKSLLVDYSAPLVLKTGEVVGVRNFSDYLYRGKFMIITHGDPATEADDPHGEGRLENVRKDWARSEMLDDEAMRTAKKIAGIIVMITHPAGGYSDANGQLVTYQQGAMQALQALTRGVGCTFETVGFDSDDYANNPELAKLSLTNAEFYDAGTIAPSLVGFTSRQQYYDARMFRGLIHPERSGLEGTHGTKAEAQTHAEVGIADSNQLHTRLTDIINQGPVDFMLEMNFGEKARGSVSLRNSSLIDAHAAVDNSILEAIEKVPELFEEWLTQLDMDAITERRGIPKLDGKTIKFSGLTVTPPQPTTSVGT